MKRLFITRPSHDTTVSYLYAWGAEIIDFVEKNNISYTDFKKEKANKQEVCQFLLKQTRLVMFNGHGNPTIIAGHKDEPLVTADENEKLLASTITYAVSCDAAAELGKKIIQVGGIAFIGYAGPFGFAHQPSRECNPAKDKFAEPFKLISNEITVSLLSGHTTKEAYDKSQQLCSQFIKKYSVNDADKESETIRFWLFWNKHFQKVYGDESARF